MHLGIAILFGFAQWLRKILDLFPSLERPAEKNSAEFRTKVRITKSEISTRTWCSLMSAASQGAFVLIPEISHSDISMHNKKIISLYKENDQRKSASVFRYAYLSVFSHPSIPLLLNAFNTYQ